jgi:hypothetical protein
MAYQESFVIIAFRSRQHALHFSQILKISNCPAQLISTPKEISLGCGLSLRFPANLISKVMQLYGRYSQPIIGFYHVQRTGNRSHIRRIPYSPSTDNF